MNQEFKIQICSTANAEVRENIRRALWLLDMGMPNTAERWLYRAADVLQAENERRHRAADLSGGA